MKQFFTNLWETIKNWALKVALPFLKKSWMQIVNILILFVAYGALDESTLAGGLVGFWLFILLGYYIFWKLFGAEHIFPIKTVQAPQPEEIKIPEVKEVKSIEKPFKTKKPTIKKKV